jgi:NAD+ synthase (glutamine-hydrolysing)
MLGAPLKNADIILDIINKLDSDFALFPELSTTGYTCQDLFYHEDLIRGSNEAIKKILLNNKYKGILLIGAPISIAGSLFNCAVIIKNDKILGIVPKKNIPNSQEFYEKRWFKSGFNETRKEIYFQDQLIPFGNLLFTDIKNHIHFSVEICEDMWAPICPSNLFATVGANMTFNLSASNETVGKSDVRRNMVLFNSRRNCGAYIYTSASNFESTSDTIYSSHNIIASLGHVINEGNIFTMDNNITEAYIDISRINYNRRMNTNLHTDDKISFDFKEIYFTLDEINHLDNLKMNKLPFCHELTDNKYYDNICNIITYSLYKRILKINAKSVVIGVSGGLDSTLALLLCHKTFKMLNMDTKKIIAITMPGFGTSIRTKKNAINLMNKLNVTYMNMPIKNMAKKHLEEIGHDFSQDITYENAQARIRTLNLMDIANKENGIVIGTGDMSELALGWCTYNGDQMSMYGINAGVPKTLVRFLTKQYGVYKYIDLASILKDIIDTPISPELSNQNQSTEDSIGKYEINDFILNRFLAYGDDKERISFLLKKTFNMSDEDINKNVSNFFRRFFSQQFKRQALPDGPKVLDISLSPRSDFRMPSDISRK